MAGIAAIPAIMCGLCTGLGVSMAVGITDSAATEKWWVGLLAGVASGIGTAACISKAGISYIFKEGHQEEETTAKEMG